MSDDVMDDIKGAAGFLFGILGWVALVLILAALPWAALVLIAKLVWSLW